MTGIYPSAKVAQELKVKSEEKSLTDESIEGILLDKKTDQRTFTLSTKTIEKYFPADYSKEDIERTLIELLKQWNRGQ